MIKNIFRLKEDLVVTLDNGKEYKTNHCTHEMYSEVLNISTLSSDDEIVESLNELFYPEDTKIATEYNTICKSSILTIENESARIPSISNLTLPQSLAFRIADAEERNDQDALTAYKNFWTLLSLNPNSAVRDNLFWFLNKWGMSICKSGLFVAYRNVELRAQGIKYNQDLTEFVSGKYYEIKNKKENPEDYSVIVVSHKYSDYAAVPNNAVVDTNEYLGNLAKLYQNIVFANDNAGTVYTDNYTHSMTIRLGQIVSIPRKECDESQVSCSRGLHAGGRGWLKSNYCGSVGLKVLINPADVCSAPRIDEYGKLRTCAYYPIQVIKFNDEGDIMDKTVPDGFEVDFLYKICYNGKINNVDNDLYKLATPKQAINIESIYENLLNTAKNIKRKV